MSFIKRSITLEGQKYYYWQANKSKPATLVLLHGFPGNHQSLLELGNCFSDFNVIIPDLPACGISDPLTERANLNSYTDWLNNFFVQAKVTTPIIFGHSFGSRVALNFGEQYPGVASALILATPVTKVDGLIAQVGAWEYQIAGWLPDYLQKLWLSNGLYKNITTLILYKSSRGKRRQHLVAMASKEISRVSPKVSIELFSDFNNSNLLKAAKKLSLPTLAIAGQLDEIAPLATVRELVATMPRAELKVIDSSGHMVPLERPRATAKIMKDWLKKIQF